MVYEAYNCVYEQIIELPAGSFLLVRSDTDRHIPSRNLLQF
jgi:hypothetical protein